MQTTLAVIATIVMMVVMLGGIVAWVVTLGDSLISPGVAEQPQRS